MPPGSAASTGSRGHSIPSSRGASSGTHAHFGPPVFGTLGVHQRHRDLNARQYLRCHLALCQGHNLVAALDETDNAIGVVIAREQEDDLARYSVEDPPIINHRSAGGPSAALIRNRRKSPTLQAHAHFSNAAARRTAGANMSGDLTGQSPENANGHGNDDGNNWGR